MLTPALSILRRTKGVVTAPQKTPHARTVFTGLSEVPTGNPAKSEPNRTEHTEGDRCSCSETLHHKLSITLSSTEIHRVLEELMAARKWVEMGVRGGGGTARNENTRVPKTTEKGKTDLKRVRRCVNTNLHPKLNPGLYPALNINCFATKIPRSPTDNLTLSSPYLFLSRKLASFLHLPFSLKQIPHRLDVWLANLL